jgi:hypothetical protein
MQIGKSIAIGLSTLSMVGCVPQVHYSPAMAGLVGKPKAQSCRIEFLRSKLPERPYDELGGLFVEGSTEPEDLQEALSRKACELGADAVLITRDYTPAFGRVPATMTGTAVRYRVEGAAAVATPADPCQVAFAVGKWSLCQVAGSAVYVWWTGEGESVAAKFPKNGAGAWFVRRGGKVFEVEAHECRGENSPTCGQTVYKPAKEQSWGQPATGAIPALEDDTQFSFGKSRVELSAKEILVRLPDGHTIVMPSDRAGIEMGIRDSQRYGLWPAPAEQKAAPQEPPQAAATPAPPDACKVAYAIGKWSLCQVASSAVYVWWTGSGPELAAKFPGNGAGPWFLRRGGKVVKVEGHRCRGENSPTCNFPTQDPVKDERWERPTAVGSPDVNRDMEFKLGKTHFELFPKQLVVHLPDGFTVGIPDDRATVDMGYRDEQRSAL